MKCPDLNRSSDERSVFCQTKLSLKSLNMKDQLSLRLKIILSALVISLLFGLAKNSTGQEITNAGKDTADRHYDWRFLITPYAMLASQATDVGSTKLRQSFGDLSSLTNFGIQLATTVNYKNWIFTSDITYAYLTKQAASGPLNINIDIKQLMLDLRLGYFVVNRLNYKNKKHTLQGWVLEVNAGAKYWQNKLTLNYDFTLENPLPDLEGKIDENQDWWDPMVGARSRVILNRVVSLGMYLSYGGFGIGNSSKYSWDFLYSNSFVVSKLLMINTGFRAFKYKRIDPGNDGDVVTKVTVVGPLLGVTFYF